MVLRGNEQRRRRVVMDEAIQSPNVDINESTGVVDPATVPKSRRARQYSRGADRRNQTRVSDFVPKRVASLLAVWLVCLAAILLFNFGERFGSRLEQILGLDAAGQLTLTATPSVRVWFCTIACFLSGLVCLQIYTLRQHRCNDYRGTYRVWRWFGAALIVLSLGCVVNLPQILTAIVSATTGKGIAWTDTVIIGVQIVLIVGLITRALIEVRSSPASVATLVGAGLACSAALILQQRWLVRQLGTQTEWIAGNLALLGILGLMMGVLTYSRFVILHASGAIEVKSEVSRRRKKTRKAGQKKQLAAKRRLARSVQQSSVIKEAPTEKLVPSNKPIAVASQSSQLSSPRAEAKPVQHSNPPLMAKMANRSNSPAPPANQNSSKSVPPIVPPQTDQEADDDDSSDDGYANLSRSERKRLRKLQQNKRRAA